MLQIGAVLTMYSCTDVPHSRKRSLDVSRFLPLRQTLPMCMSSGSKDASQPAS